MELLQRRAASVLGSVAVEHSFRQLFRRSNKRLYSLAGRPRYQPLAVLQDVNINVFRDRYFKTEQPTILSRDYFDDIPAFHRWFLASPGTATEDGVTRLNVEYLRQHAADAFVPLELTQPESGNTVGDGRRESTITSTFRAFHGPLSLFLDWISSAESESSQRESPRLYLAQCQLLDLPAVLRDDFPTPRIVSQAGKGDIYDTNLWIGLPPTYTPLHRDPNPNIFVQLAGRKRVRLMSPDDGMALFASVRRQIGRSGDRDSAVFRGEEMMQGHERVLLERAVWDDAAVENVESVRQPNRYEATLKAGDGLFIPKGWWHSIKGVGEGVTASVNWWFR